MTKHSADKPAPSRVTDDGLRGYVGYNIKRAMVAVQTDVLAALAPYDLRLVTFSALALVGDNPGLSQSQLAAALAVERPNLVAVVDELSARGLLTRERVPTDRRTYALRLTTAGARLLAQASEAVHAHEEADLKGLTTEERALLVKLLNTIELAAKRS